MDGLTGEHAVSTRQATAVDRRVIGRAIRQWESLLTERGLPSYADCLAGFDGQFEDGLVLFRFDPDPAAELISACGQDFIVALGWNPTGRPISEVLPSATQRQLQLWRVAAESLKPVADIGEFQNSNGTDILYRCVFLPVSENGEDVSQILAVFSYRMAL